MILDSIVNTVLAKCPSTMAIYVFGTFNSNDQRDSSDLDLAVLLPVEESFSNKEELNLALTELVKRDVDLIDLRHSNTVFQQEIILNGNRLFAASEIDVENYELLIMAKYRQLNQERAEIIKAGLETGFYE